MTPAPIKSYTRAELAIVMGWSLRTLSARLDEVPGLRVPKKRLLNPSHVRKVFDYYGRPEID